MIRHHTTRHGYAGARWQWPDGKMCRLTELDVERGYVSAYTPGGQLVTHAISDGAPSKLSDESFDSVTAGKRECGGAL